MRFSTKGRYGLRAMMDLAAFSYGEHVALSSIAERQGISLNYLEQVFGILRKAGLVRSVKGSQGGFALAEKPSKISIGAILRALEGDLSVADDAAECTSTIQICLKKMVWDRMDQCLNEAADAMTLEELANEYRRMNGSEPLMYYI